MRFEGVADSSNNATRHPSQPLSNGSAVSALSSPLKASSLANGDSSDGHTNGHSTERPTGPFFGHDREEVTRILIQSLSDLGYHNAAGTLSRESGFELELPTVAAFRAAIQAGEWAEAEALLFGARQEPPSALLATGRATNWQKSSQSPSPNLYAAAAGLPLSEGVNKHEMLFLMRQQKYLELLESRNLPMALMVLRQELTPLHQDVARLHFLSRHASSHNTCREVIANLPLV